MYDRAPDVHEDADLGSAAAKFPDHTGVLANVERFDPSDEDATVSVDGHWYDDEDGWVEVEISTADEIITATVGPDTARQLAEDLEGAADFAEGGAAGDPSSAPEG